MLTAYTASDDPVAFLRDLQNWDAFMFPVICAILTWLGDILVVSQSLSLCQWIQDLLEMFVPPDISVLPHLAA